MHVESNDPNNVQYGGTHYRSTLQHWDLMAILGCGWEYWIAAATKYTTRYSKTDKDGNSGELAVQKAIHYVDKLCHLVATGILPEKFRTTQGFRLNLDAHPGPYLHNVNTESIVQEYLDLNRIADENARRAIEILCSAQVEADLIRARVHLQSLLDKLQGVTNEPKRPPSAAERAEASAANAAQALGAKRKKAKS